MNSKLSNARLKLLELSKKYSAGNLKKYEKPFSSSNESVSESSTSVPKIIKNEIYVDKKDRLRSSSSSNINFEVNESGWNLIADKQNIVSLSKESVEKKTSSNKSPCNHVSIKSPKTSNKISDDSIHIKRISSDSDVSSVESYKTKTDDKSVVEEVISNEDIESSSVNDPFANVHLVSDDILDEIDSSIGLHSSIKEEILTGRLSAVQSIKSLPLSSPIEPPKLEYNYESDFESSDDEKNTRIQDSIMKIQEANEQSVEDCDDVISEDLGKSVDKLFPPSPQFSKVHLFNSKAVENDIQIYPFIDESKTFAKNSSSSSDGKSKSQILVQDGSSKNNEQLVVSNLSDFEKSEIDKSSEIITNLKSSGEDKNKSSIKTVSSGKPSFDKKCFRPGEIPQDNVNVKTKLSKSAVHCKNKGVQTSECLLYRAKTIEFDESNLKSTLREKWYINTNVKETRDRPGIKSSPLFDSSTRLEDIPYNPNTFSTQNKLPADQLLDEILRNQIAMTKHFIKCHHNLYIHCCQTVKSLNKKYKKSQVALIL